jgi:hypothetical protein
MIYAIAIYTTDANCSYFNKKDSYPAENPGLFSSNLLAELEKESLPILSTKTREGKKIEGIIYPHEMPREQHFFLKITDSNTKQHFVLAIVSKTKFTNPELNQLFNNINKIRTRLAKSTTLKDLVDNPLGYTGKDVQILEINSATADTKASMSKNLELLIERGEDLERLKEKSDMLNTTVVRFHRKAKEANTQCCSVYGYGY